MSIESVRRSGQEMAARQMTDRVKVERPSGGFTTDTDTGAQVPAVDTVHGEVAAWVRPLSQQSRIVESGGQPVTLLTYDILLPASVDGIKVDDLVTVLATAGTDLAGKTLTVVDVTFGSHQVARRLVCQIQLGGA